MKIVCSKEVAYLGDQKILALLARVQKTSKLGKNRRMSRGLNSGHIGGPASNFTRCRSTPFNPVPFEKWRLKGEWFDFEEVVRIVIQSIAKK